jgi:hypothetical protein
MIESFAMLSFAPSIQSASLISFVPNTVITLAANHSKLVGFRTTRCCMNVCQPGHSARYPYYCHSLLGEVAPSNSQEFAMQNLWMPMICSFRIMCICLKAAQCQARRVSTRSTAIHLHSTSGSCVTWRDFKAGVMQAFSNRQVRLMPNLLTHTYEEACSGLSAMVILIAAHRQQARLLLGKLTHSTIIRFCLDNTRLFSCNSQNYHEKQNTH